MASPGKALIVVENNSVPFDPRVWREARSLHEAGWQVSVICPQSPHDDRLARTDSTTGAYEVLDGIHIYRFPLTFAAHGAAAYVREYLEAFYHITRLVWRVHDHSGFDVLQVCNPPDIFFPLGFLCRLLAKGFIFDHHDLFPESVKFRYPGWTGAAAYGLARLTEWLTYRSADVVMATNESYRQLAIDRGGLPPERVIVVRNGPELAADESRSPIPELKDGFPYLVCYLGMMGAEDGVEPMLESIRHIVHGLGRRDIRFVLIGDGPARQLGLDRLTDWDLSPNVSMPGRLPQADVQSYLLTADVCLSPDPHTPLNNLSTMNKVMEYMAVGKPLVSFELKEARYSAQSAAVYVPSGDVQAFGQAVVDLLDDPRLRERMGAEGRRRVREMLAWEHQKSNLLAAYALARRR